MENVNVNVNVNEMDLGLALGRSSVDLSSNNRYASAGANANSNLIIDTTPRPRPFLSELVWSTQNGLTIKCANQTQSRSQLDDEKCHIISPRSITPAPFLGSSQSHTDENVGEAKCVQMENCNKGKEKECISSYRSMPDYNLAGTSAGPKTRITADLLPVLLAKEPGNIGDGTDGISLDFGLRLKMQDTTQSACQERALAHLKKEEDCNTSGFLEKIEETAENDVMIKDTILKNMETEDSHDESMHSGNNILSKGNKRWRFEEHLIIESKRIKKQSQECPPTTTQVVKQQDSSFMNWISNMVKGEKPIGFDDHKTLNMVSKGLGFQTVFQSLYSQDGKPPEETKIPIESSKSKEIILFNKSVSCNIPDDDDDSLNQKTCGNLWITRLSPKTTSNLLSSNNKSSASLGLNTPHEIDATRPACLQMNENRNGLLKKNKILNEDDILLIPKQMLDTIKRLRLSLTDILKWMDSGFPIVNIVGYFVRLRLAKWEEGVGGSRYHVACITDGKPSKKSICVKIGGVECVVESRYISNCDFLQDELIAWWRTSGPAALKEIDLASKLEERNKF